MIEAKVHKQARALLFLLTVCLCVSIMSLKTKGAAENVIPCQSSSKAYAIYFYNIENSAVMFEKNADKKISPASTVKLMTAMVAFDNIKDINQTVTITEKMISGVSGNSMKLQVGEKIRVSDLFWGLVCSGSNDAANALAVIACGSVNKFIEKMNDKAALLGANDTVYTDPTGMDDSAQTTAYDTMLIAKAFMSYEELLKKSTVSSYSIPATNISDARTIHNRNAMISNRSVSKYLNSLAMGMNAGMTSGGGYCVVTAMNRDGMTYLCVVMGGTYDEKSDTVYSYVVANELLNYVAKNLGYRTVLSTDSNISTLPVIGADLHTDCVNVAPKSDISAYLPSDYLESGDFTISYIYSKSELVAPVVKGDSVGKIVVRYKDDIIAVTDIVAVEDIPRDSFIYSMILVRNILFGRGFISGIVFFVVITACYFLIKSRKASARRKHRNLNKYKY